ncbi:hypothetical protein SESBI_34742 [Sesbania bispinosa]|nr:hypothetical protein SESBI_34742 [Sesbania bispinosa]
MNVQVDVAESCFCWAIMNMRCVSLSYLILMCYWREYIILLMRAMQKGNHEAVAEENGGRGVTGDKEKGKVVEGSGDKGAADGKGKGKVVEGSGDKEAVDGKGKGKVADRRGDRGENDTGLIPALQEVMPETEGCLSSTAAYTCLSSVTIARHASCLTVGARRMLHSNENALSPTATIPTSVISQQPQSLRRERFWHRREMRIQASSFRLLDLRWHRRGEVVAALTVDTDPVLEDEGAMFLIDGAEEIKDCGQAIIGEMKGEIGIDI